MSKSTPYKAHFDVKVQDLTELQSKLEWANRRLAFLETADPEFFSKELTDTRDMVKQLEQNITNILGEDGASLEAAPGAETGFVGKLNTLLSRHQRIMAKEEADYGKMSADLEAEITEIRSQQAAATRLHQAQLAANEAL